MALLVWDVDDVLNDATRSWLAWAQAAGDAPASLRYEELTENPPHRLLGWTRSRFLESLDAFRASDAGRAMPPRPEILSWLQRHGDRHDHIALTARPLGSVPVLVPWIFEHFGRWIRGFHFVPSPRPGVELPNRHPTKGDYLSILATEALLIDDGLDNVESARAHGFQALLFPAPWNRAEGSPAQFLEQFENLPILT